MPEPNTFNSKKLEHDDQQNLIQRFQQGEEDAFVQIIELYHPQIHSLASRLLGWSCQVEDVVQDVFLAALTSRRKFKAKSSIRTWLFTITVNKCRSWKFRQGLWRKFSSQHGCQTKTALGSEGDLQQLEKNEQVRDAVNKLPVKYRQVIVLRFLNQLGTSEIKEILGISENVINTRVSRAKILLKDKLQDIVVEK